MPSLNFQAVRTVVSISQVLEIVGLPLLGRAPFMAPVARRFSRGSGDRTEPMAQPWVMGERQS